MNLISANISPKEITKQFRNAEHVFNRFNIDPYNTSKIYENTALAEINPDFLVDVLKVFCLQYPIKGKTFNQYTVPTIVDYLQKSHVYYLEKMLPEIGQSIAILLQNYENDHPLLNILYKFYFNYIADLQEHIKEEEELLFPYAKKLYQSVNFKTGITFFKPLLKEYSIVDFIKAHTDTEDNLDQVKKVLLSYDPPKTNKSSYRILLQKLKTFESDLNLHAFIEDDILVPKLAEFESKLSEIF